MCGAKVGGPSLEGVDVADATIVQGVVVAGEEPVAGAYVRLLDADGEFTAEVVTSATGQFRFFARPGTWLVRVLSAGGSAEQRVTARQGEPVDLRLDLAG
jgi:uncharacterized GH25 family protein